MQESFGSVGAVTSSRIVPTTVPARTRPPIVMWYAEATLPTIVGPPSSIWKEPSGAIGNARASGPIPPPMRLTRLPSG